VVKGNGRIYNTKNKGDPDSAYWRDAEENRRRARNRYRIRNGLAPDEKPELMKSADLPPLVLNGACKDKSPNEEIKLCTNAKDTEMDQYYDDEALMRE
jgi:hypothetical protein